MAVTTSFPDPPPPNHVPLPWNADARRVRMCLTQRSAAVVNWLDTLYPDEVIAVRGDVPPPVMRELEERLRDLHRTDLKGNGAGSQP